MIILFGSQARGDARPDSDVDFLVVQPEVNSRREEMTFLSNLLRPLRLPADVLVASRRTFEKWASLPGTIYHTARMEGRVLYGRAGEVSARPEICGNFVKLDGGDANDRGASQFFATPSPIPMVPEGHLKIAQYFSAGSATEEAPSPDRDGRLISPRTRSSLRDLRMESPRTQHSSAGLFSVVPPGRPRPCRVAAKPELRPNDY